MTLGDLFCLSAAFRVIDGVMCSYKGNASHLRMCGGMIERLHTSDNIYDSVRTLNQLMYQSPHQCWTKSSADPSLLCPLSTRTKLSRTQRHSSSLRPRLYTPFSRLYPSFKLFLSIDPSVHPFLIIFPMLGTMGSFSNPSGHLNYSVTGRAGSFAIELEQVLLPLGQTAKVTRQSL